MRAVPIHRFRGEGREAASDLLAEEEPLEIRIGTDHDGTLIYRSLAVTMRTPGEDADLAAGFLFTEGILTEPTQIAAIAPWGLPNVIKVDLAHGVAIDWRRLERNAYVTSSCGVCGKTSLDLVEQRITRRLDPGSPKVDAAWIQELPARLEAEQATFRATGGLHAAALFGVRSELHLVREDVGRHNAVDKLIGARWRAGHGFGETILLLSGRAGFELIQKAALAGIPVVAAIGAPTSLAAELAEEVGITLIGFLRGERFNVYCGAERMKG